MRMPEGERGEHTNSQKLRVCSAVSEGIDDSGGKVRKAKKLVTF